MFSDSNGLRLPTQWYCTHRSRRCSGPLGRHRPHLLPGRSQTSPTTWLPKCLMTSHRGRRTLSFLVFKAQNCLSLQLWWFNWMWQCKIFIFEHSVRSEMTWALKFTSLLYIFLYKYAFLDCFVELSRTRIWIFYNYELASYSFLFLMVPLLNVQTLLGGLIFIKSNIFIRKRLFRGSLAQTHLFFFVQIKFINNFNEFYSLSR